MQKYYNCESAEQRLTVLAELFKLGYVWHKDTNAMHTPEEIEAVYGFDQYPTLVVNPNTGNMSGNLLHTHGVGDVSLEQLLVPYVPAPAPVEIRVGDYTAIIWAGVAIIKIGCQRIHISTAREIVAAWEQLNPAKTV